MRKRIQRGQVLKLGGNWHVRYWVRRTANSVIERKRVTHLLCAVTTRGKTPPADVLTAARKYMATLNDGTVTPERIVTIGDFVAAVYLPWVQTHNRPSTAAQYSGAWKTHLGPLCGSAWLRDTRTFHVQQWLDVLGTKGLSRNTLKRLKGTLSGIFRLAKQQDFFTGENPVRDTRTNPAATAPAEMYAYSPEDAQTILGLLPEPACTVFAVAAYTGLRIGEIAGLEWQDYHDGELHVTRSIWKGRVSPPKTNKSAAGVPVIPALAQRLEMHRARSGNPESGPIFRNSLGRPLELANLTKRIIKPALAGAAVTWRGFHAARRGLGSNLYRLGVQELVIQRILRHSNISTTQGFYIKTVAEDVRDAMGQLEKSLSDTGRTVKPN
jgi:integrase